MARDHHFYFAKRLLPAEVFGAPEGFFERLTGPIGDVVLEAKWANACAVSGAGESQPAPKLAGTSESNGWRLALIAMPPATEPNEAAFAAICLGPEGPRIFWYERCLAADLRSLSETGCVLASTDGEQRVNHGRFEGLGLGAFAKALSEVLGVAFAAPS